MATAHRLQRKTYHMALDYVDRVLSFTENLPKMILQLLGVAALNIAAKIEVIIAVLFVFISERHRTSRWMI